tara:strand:+ start:170 stop:430 length:261 start_codon:yes stop_codon:yes gene_type:complete
MPNTKSAIRRVRRVKQQTAINRIRMSKYRSTIKRMTKLILEKKKKDAKAFLPEFHSRLMKIVKTGVINKRTASRKISKLTKKLAQL